MSKVLCTDSASTKKPILGGFWALSPPVWSNIAKLLTGGNTLANKNTENVENVLKIRVFMEKGRTQS